MTVLRSCYENGLLCDEATFKWRVRVFHCFGPVCLAASLKDGIWTFKTATAAAAP